MSEVLAQLAIEISADNAPLYSSMDRAVSYAQRSGDRAGSAFALGFQSPVLNALGGISQLISGTRDTIGLIYAGTGMKAAAELGYYRRQLIGIAGDAKVAGAAYKSFQDIAANSNFDTDQVFSFGLKMAGKSGDVGQAVKQTQELLDAATAFGVKNTDFEQFQRNTTQLENKGGEKINKVDYHQQLNYAPLMTKKVADALGISVVEASKKIENSTGKQFADIIGKVGAANKGAAAKEAGADPGAVGANLVDNLKNAMAPTGAVLNSIATPTLQFLNRIVGGFQNVNEVTGGSLGLIALLGGGSLALRYFGGSVASAVATTRSLTSAVTQYAIAAEAAAVASNSAARGQATQAITSGITGRFPAGGMGAGFATVGKFGKFAAGAGKLAMGAAEFAIPIAIDYGLNAYGGNLKNSKNPMQKQRGAGLAGMGTGVGYGALIGGIIGTFILPGLGSLAGAAIGGVLGGAIGAGKGIYDEKQRQAAERGGNSAQERTANATERAANALTEIKGKLYGGGPRGNQAVSLIESEYALMHQLI